MKLSESLPPLTRRQRDILDFFVSYRNENRISPTLEEIARNFGLNKVTIFGHVSELEKKGVLVRSAKGISRGLQLADMAEDEHDSGARLPICGTIAAGAPIEAIESSGTDETLELADLIPPHGDVYVLRVQGNSMIEDAICDGDLVLIERRTEARNGETVVAVLPDEETTLKRFYRENGHIRLQPANSTMQPIITKDVELRGVVVGVVRKY
jgi:repressor LexA